MAAESNRDGVVRAVSVDLRELHESWMELVFPRQRTGTHSVLGKWKPSTPGGRAAYRLWSAVGALMVALLYPLALGGFVARFYSRRIDATAASLGVIGVLVLSLVAWGSLTAFAHVRFSPRGFAAVAAAAGVATVAAVAAIIFARIGGRRTSVVFAYPAAMTALFLPPVVAALFSPTLGRIVLPGSTTVAIWLLDTVFVYGGLDAYFRESYTLEGVAYVAMWFGIAVPVGWFLGIIVTLANVVRP